MNCSLGFTFLWLITVINALLHCTMCYDNFCLKSWHNFGFFFFLCIFVTLCHFYIFYAVILLCRWHLECALWSSRSPSLWGCLNIWLTLCSWIGPWSWSHSLKVCLVITPHVFVLLLDWMTWPVNCDTVNIQNKNRQVILLWFVFTQIFW